MDLIFLFQGFTLHFYFAPNDYFSNSVLTKEYEMKCEPSEDDPFSFEGKYFIYRSINFRNCDFEIMSGFDFF